MGSTNSHSYLKVYAVVIIHQRNRADCTYVCCLFVLMNALKKYPGSSHLHYLREMHALIKCKVFSNNLFQKAYMPFDHKICLSWMCYVLLQDNLFIIVYLYEMACLHY